MTARLSSCHRLICCHPVLRKKHTIVRKNDIYSSDTVKTAPTDSALKIKKVQFDTKRDAMYDLTDLGKGTYAILDQDNTVPAKAAGILGGNSNETTLYKRLVSFVF